MAKATFVLILLVFLLCVGGFLYLNYLLYTPTAVITFQQQQFPVLTKKVKAGQAVKYQVDAEQLTTDVAVMVNWRIICGDIQIARPNTGYVTKAGSLHYINDTIVLPMTTPLGKCYVDTISSYHVNALHTIVIEHRTEDFTVVE